MLPSRCREGPVLTLVQTVVTRWSSTNSKSKSRPSGLAARSSFTLQRHHGNTRWPHLKTWPVDGQVHQAAVAVQRDVIKKKKRPPPPKQSGPGFPLHGSVIVLPYLCSRARC